MRLDPAEIRRILFVHFGGIGDVVLAFPAIKSLRETFPEARISLLVEPRARGVGAFNPAIDEVLTFDAKARPSLGEFLDLLGVLRTRGFDLAIASGRSPAMAGLLLLSGARYRVGYAASPLAWTLSQAVPLNVRQYAGHMYYDLVARLVPTAPRLPQLVVAPEDRSWAAEFLAGHGVVEGDRVAVLHPGASAMAERRGIHKTWDARSWAQLSDGLRRGGLKVVLAGGPDDDRIVRDTLDLLGPGVEGDDFIVAYGSTRSLGQLAGLVSLANLLVAVDSAPMHIGIGVDTPTIGLFGPTDPDKLMPAGTIHQAVHVGGLTCRPCLWERRQTTCSDLTCLKTLTVDQVLQAAWRVLPARPAAEPRSALP